MERDGASGEGGETTELFRTSDLRLPGAHNLANGMAAALLARALGASADDCRRALAAFEGLPHRTQRVAEAGGVVWYDDSKGTNPAATLGCLRGFEDGTVHLILGGSSKDSDYGELRDAVAAKAARVYLIGETAGAIEEALRGAVEISRSETLDRAVAEAAETPAPGSRCCCRRRAPASTSSRISRIVARRSSAWSGTGWATGGRPEPGVAPMAKKLVFDRVLFAAVSLAVLFGLVMVYSATAAMARAEADGPGFNPYAAKQVLAALLGLVGMAVFMHFDYRHLRRPAVIYTLLGGLVMLLVMVLFSREINGTHRWFDVGPVSFQPSELAKLVLVAYAAYQIEKKPERINQPAVLAPVLGAAGLVVGLVLLQPDFGTAVLLLISVLLVLFLAGLAWRFLAVGALVSVPVLAFLVLAEEYRRRRLFAFLNPESDPLGASFQAHQSLIAVGSGGSPGSRARGQRAEAPLPALRPLGLHLLDRRRGAGAARRRGAPGPLRGHPVARRPGRPRRPGPLRPLPRLGDHRGDRAPGPHPRERLPLPGAVQGHPAPVHLLRRLVAHGLHDRLRRPPQRLATRMTP